MLERLALEMVRTRSERVPLGVAMIDIDHFKQVNDAYGHAAGDQVLCEIVTRAAAALRPYDVFGRMGGEEFLVAVPGLPAARLRSVLDRVRLAIAEPPIVAEGRPLTVTVSIGGIAGDGDSVDDLIRTADDALYRAKAEGRNRVVVLGRDRVTTSVDQSAAGGGAIATSQGAGA